MKAFNRMNERGIEKRCGWVNIRIRDTGMYYCEKCGKDLGCEFGTMFRIQQPAGIVATFERQLHL